MEYLVQHDKNIHIFATHILKKGDTHLQPGTHKVIVCPRPSANAPLNGSSHPGPSEQRGVRICPCYYATDCIIGQSQQHGIIIA